MGNRYKFSRRRIYLLFAAAGFLLAAAWVLHAVFTSTSSTAAIGLIFVPFYGLGGAILGCAVAYVGFALADVFAGRRAWHSSPVLFSGLLLAAAALFGSTLLLERNALAVALDPRAPPEMLEEISRSWIPLGRRNVDIALMKNPATPAALLTAVVEDGRDGYLVSLAGAHVNTPLPVLEKIAAGPIGYERMGGLATHPRLTPAMAERLANVGPGDFGSGVEYKLYQTYVLAALVRNPATPQAVFDRLAAREAPEYFLALAVLRSPRASCRQLAQTGSTGGEVLHSTAMSELKRRGC
ncbi:MAG: hypothetical protein KF771_10710 [Burkholderiales bacterium]|nr:hypothetical protein [Burkholderiales bacterium]